MLLDVKKYNFPGAILSVCKAGKTIEHQTAGYSDVSANKAVSSDLLIQNGRITRLFTAAILLRLVDNGALDLEAPLELVAKRHQQDSGVLKLIVTQYPYLKPITIRELLNHTSGIPGYDKTAVYEKRFAKNPKKVWQAEGYLDLITGTGIRYQSGYNMPVRGFFGDSATNYILAGLVMEAVAGKRTSQNMSELFLQFKMKDTFYFPYGILNEDLLPRLMHGYLPVSHPHADAFSKLPINTYNNNRELQVYDVTSAYNFNGLGNSATVSTTSDLIRFMRLLMNCDVVQGSFKSLFTTVPVSAKKDGVIDQYGLGIYKTIMPKYGEIVWSVGNSYGYAVLLAHALEKDITFVLALNASRQKINLHNSGIVANVLANLL